MQARFPRHFPRRGDRGRRGMALIVVMVAVAVSLTLTVAFLQSQAVALQIDANISRREAALAAARTGAAVALRIMQSPEWGGVDVELTATVQSDGAGTSSYRVTFEQLPASHSLAPIERGLAVVVKSVGTWTDAANPAAKTERTVEVVARLQPRLSGRAIRPGDNAAADDLAPNPAGYDQIQQYALYAQKDTSLVLDPQARIDGRLHVQSNISLFNGLAWSSTIRREYLESIGRRYVADGVLQHPHPYGGNGLPAGAAIVDFAQNGQVGLLDDLTRLGVSTAPADSSFLLPAVDSGDWSSYRLYAGGFRYDAQPVSSPLRNVTLGPSPENPLGVFYCHGSLSVESDVTIIGTLVSSGTVTLRGDSIHLAAWQPRDTSGAPLFPDVGVWPRLPALVADQIEIDRRVWLRIEGAIVARQRFRCTAGDFEFRAVPLINITGTATARPIAQPMSVVKIGGSVSLAGVRGDEDHAIWLAQGSSGAWFPIRAVDPVRRELIVSGQVEHATPTPFRIARNRQRYVDIRGPLSGEQHEILRSSAWGSVSSLLWTLLYYEWDLENRYRKNNGLPTVELVDWLADSSNFAGWSYPYSAYGLPLEPTFHLAYSGTERYRWSPPLFRPWSGGPSNAEHSGYRWKVLSWRELP